MDIRITARHFTANDSLREYAFAALKKLERYYNGILNADMVLSYQKMQNSVKTVELHVSVYGMTLKSVSESEDFSKSVDEAIDKVERQIQRYKSKLRDKEKEKIRKVTEKV
ncbi:MAG TPA: ribosome-associated translation inhibitor RaiA [Bacteroidota bacterium]|nr:ribosome-associated translation inhibitor RaiA [Bacteroidota bacterium]